MKKDDIEQLFESLVRQLSVQEPSKDHKARFLEKLQSVPKTKEVPVRSFNWWKPLAIAASIALIFMITPTLNT